jgi:hypothetical protein
MTFLLEDDAGGCGRGHGRPSFPLTRRSFPTNEPA